eukprot:7697487-Alexandrium_andersonii.AAC.1
MPTTNGDHAKTTTATTPNTQRPHPATADQKSESCEAANPSPCDGDDGCFCDGDDDGGGDGIDVRGLHRSFWNVRLYTFAVT